MGLKCYSYQDFVKLGNMLCFLYTNTAVAGSIPSYGGSGFYFGH